MKFVVFGYNFPHWKTQNGLINLVANGYRPDIVILQDKKELNFRQSSYRITPVNEYLLDPKKLCDTLGIHWVVKDHDEWGNSVKIPLGVILGARILKKETIQRFPKGVLNIHPGILPGNRGLDNLKWSILKNLPIGVTAHFIDERIDRGKIIKTIRLKPNEGESIRDLYIRQRNLEQRVLVETMWDIENNIINLKDCEYSEKFNAVPDELDNFNDYKASNINTKLS